MFGHSFNSAVGGVLRFGRPRHGLVWLVAPCLAFTLGPVFPTPSQAVATPTTPAPKTGPGVVATSTTVAKPAVTAVAPGSGPATGATSVTINGTPASVPSGSVTATRLGAAFG
jgi:hypothetical protein